MQPIKLMKFWRQFTVLVQRNLRLILNDKLTMASLILQAPFMVLVIKMVVDPDCFTSNLINIGSRTALFILREASVGVSLLAVVLSKAFVLLLIEDVQAAILTFGFVRIVNIPQNHLLLDTDVEIFVSILLMLVASSAIGLLISAIFKSGESAILVVLVLMIGQVVFSGIMFTLTGVAARIAAVVVCRWGMGALGASTDLNSRLAWLKQGFDSPMYDATVANLMHSWQMMGLITVVCLIAAWLVLQISFNRRKA